MSNSLIFKAVIEQAFADASWTGRQAERDRREAQRFLLTDNQDFPLVCQLAEVEPDGVRAHARKLAERRWLDAPIKALL